MGSVVMMNDIYAECRLCSVANKPIMLSIIMLDVLMLSVVEPTDALGQ